LLRCCWQPMRCSTTQVAALPRGILLALFQGEQFGRLGSRRWVAEVQSFACAANVSRADSPTGLPLLHQPAALQPRVHARAAEPRDARGGGGPGGAARPWGASSCTRTTGAPPLPLPLTASLPSSRLWGRTCPWASRQSARPASPCPPAPSAASRRRPLPGCASHAAVLSGYNASYASTVYHSSFDNASNVDAAVVARSATVLGAAPLCPR